MNKAIISASIIALLLIGFSIYSGKSRDYEPQEVTEEPSELINNISVVDGKQIIELRAKGGYKPAHSIAKAGIPTILQITTNGTFDCSAFVRIPSLDITKNLTNSGTTDIDLGIQKIGILNGTCGMGMYPFDITFQ